MKKLKTTFKGLLLVAALLLGGASSAWADPTTIYERKVIDASLNESTSATDVSALWSTNDIYNSSVDATTGGWTGDTGNTSIDATNGLKISVGSKGGEKSISKTLAISSNVILTVDAVLYDPTSETQSTSNYCYFQIGSGLRFRYSFRDANIKIIADEVTKHTVGSLTRGDNWAIHAVINTVENKITALTVAGTDILDVLSVSDISLADLSTYTQLSLGTSSTNYANAFCLKEVTVQQEIQAVATYGYTVNYKVGETLVKQVVVADGGEGARTVGSSIPVITAFNGDDMTGNGGEDYSDKRYVLVADAPVQTVTTTIANNVLDVSVREKYSTTMTVTRYFDGVAEETPFINAQELVETDDKDNSWTYVFPYYVQNNAKWYRATLKGASNDKFGETGTFTNDAVVKTITYTYDGCVTNFWDYSHSGVTNNINYSGGSKNDYQQSQSVGTLTAGCYEVTVMQDADYSAYLYKNYVDKDNRGTQLGNQFTSSNRTQIIELNADASGVMIYSGSNSRYDYVLIRKVSVNVASCDALGYTFSSTLPLDFLGTSVRAYIATYDSEKDVVKLTQKTKIPANTGLLIFSDSELTNQSIPTTVETTDNVDGNKLIAVSADMTLEAATGVNENYVLVIEGGKPVFQKIGATSASMSAGQAYLQIPARTGSGGSARTIRVVFDDEDQTTGIKNLTPTLSESEGVVYNLQGRRITQPTKGLYIVNGKKVVIK